MLIMGKKVWLCDVAKRSTDVRLKLNFSQSSFYFHCMLSFVRENGPYFPGLAFFLFKTLMQTFLLCVYERKDHLLKYLSKVANEMQEHKKESKRRKKTEGEIGIFSTG